MVYMHGALAVGLHERYAEPDAEFVSVNGAVTDSPVSAAHFMRTRLAAVPFDSMKATWVPSRERTGDVVTISPAPVLYAQLTDGTVPEHPPV
jgi:hypothetical protein